MKKLRNFDRIIEIKIDTINCPLSDLEVHLIENAIRRAIGKTTNCKLKSVTWK